MLPPSIPLSSRFPSGTRPDHKMHVCRRPRPQQEEGGKLKGLKGLLCELLQAVLFITNLHSVIEKGDRRSKQVSCYQIQNLVEFVNLPTVKGSKCSEHVFCSLKESQK